VPDVSTDERIYDVRPDKLDLRDRPYTPTLRNLPALYPAPEFIDTIIPYYRPFLLDQGSEGACTGYGLACLINYLYWTRDWRQQLLLGVTDVTQVIESFAASQTESVSPSMLYRLARFYDEWPGEDYSGSSCRGALKGWHRHGVCSSSIWPTGKSGPVSDWRTDAANRVIGSYYRVDRLSISDMQSAIFETGAIYVGAKVHKGWRSVPRNSTRLEKAIIKFDSAQIGGHAFAMVGYTQNGFIIQNSWGPEWGFEGFGIMTYEDWNQNGMDCWVASLGVPTSTVARKAFVSTSDQSTFEKIQQTASSQTIETLNTAKRAVKPWLENEDDADRPFEHSLVIGNNGMFLNRLIEFTNDDALKYLCYNRIESWINDTPQTNRDVVIYAHGGLGSEESAIERARKMGPYFSGNNIYPLFINWKTGILETFNNLMDDRILSRFSSRYQGYIYESDMSKWLDTARKKVNELKRQAIEASDYSIELAARQLVKPFWTEMKQNAHLASQTDGALAKAALHFSQLAKNYPDVRFHFIGHSAGSILLGELLDRFVSKKLPVQTCTLWAPACTLAFAEAHYLKAIDKKIIPDPKTNFVIEILSDQNERDDTTGPYQKSILYLISRALEDTHKEPVLGLQWSWETPDVSEEEAEKTLDNVYGDKHAAQINAWRAQAAKRDISLQRVVNQEMYNGIESIDGDHGNFDNDVESLSRALKLILGRKPKNPPSDLSGF
jgi:hypothetical protein